MIFEKQVIKMYSSIAHNRCDDTGTAYYFSAEDFPGLNKEAYAFTASAGHKLQGYLYQYENTIPGRIVVFDHGFGGGHRSYMREIEQLCRHGYLVFAYDHTGCMESGGATPNGMAQSLCDLNDCIKTLKADSRFASLQIAVMGHSWGGFSTLNIAALHPDITHVVSMSGFVRVELLVNSIFGGILKPWKKAIMAMETASNPDFVGFDAVESLKNTDAQVLLIYSDNDQLCRKTPHFDTLQTALSNKENVRFLLVSGKSHNPNYTHDAVKYLAEFSAARTKLMKKNPTDEQKKAFVQSFDWHRMTAQDTAVWDEIFKTLDR